MFVIIPTEIVPKSPNSPLGVLFQKYIPAPMPIATPAPAEATNPTAIVKLGDRRIGSRETIPDPRAEKGGGDRRHNQHRNQGGGQNQNREDWGGNKGKEKDGK